MDDTTGIYDRLLRGVSGGGDDAGIRLVSGYKPSGGPGTRLMPPSYPGGYVTEERVLDDGVFPVVLLDSYQSQANRVEEALLEARDEDRLKLPLFEMKVEVPPWSLRLTSFDFPHRYADAYLRDSTIAGERFDQTEIGKAFRIAQPTDAAALYQHDPGSLVFGAWNSHRNGRQPKFSRAYRSETLGICWQKASRKGGRLDPLNLTGSVDDITKREGDWQFTLTKKTKGTQLAAIGHGNALAKDPPPGGVTVTDVRRLAFVSFAQLARLRFPDSSQDAQLAARAALAALALAGDRLAFDRAGVVYRSGCELTLKTDEVCWEQRGAPPEPLELRTAEALALFVHAVAHAADLGLAMSTETIAIEPTEALRNAIEHAFLTADPES